MIMGFPPGLNFNPSDEELLFFLTRKLDGLSVPPMTIRDHHDSFLDPYSLDWSHVENMRDNERYYFMKREPVSGEGGDGKNVNRNSSEGRRGFWRSSHTDKIYGGGDRNNGRPVVVGLMTSLNFFDYNSSSKLQKNAFKTRWIMHEYKLPLETFQEWVVCRVKDNSEKKNKKNTKRQCSNSIITRALLLQLVQQKRPPPSDHPMIDPRKAVFESAVQLAAAEEKLSPLSDHSTMIDPQKTAVPMVQQPQPEDSIEADDVAGLLAGNFDNKLLLDMLSFDDLDSYIEQQFYHSAEERQREVQEVGCDKDHPRHKRPRLCSNIGGLVQHPRPHKDFQFWIPRFSETTTC